MHQILDLSELPEKQTARYPRPLSTRVDEETKRRYDIINGYRDGLPEACRAAITLIVNTHWDRLQEQLKSELESA